MKTSKPFLPSQSQSSSQSPSQSSDEIRERCLGEIAPLLAAARRIDSLSPERKRMVRRRILRTTFGTGWLALRMRPAAVAFALAALVVGGVAFAAAERLGLIPGIGKVPLPAVPSKNGSRAQNKVILPEVPDPLLLALPAASCPWRKSEIGPRVPVGKPSRPVLHRIAYNAPVPV